ncbi:MAG: glycoside hydrolase family 2 protein [Lewinella sp.]
MSNTGRKQPEYSRYHLLRLAFLFVLLTATLGAGAQVQGGMTSIEYLSGTDNDHTVDWEFYCTAGRRSKEWTTIQVPSCWEQQGFGNYDYGRDYRTFGKRFRFADEKGIYRHQFTAKKEWKNQQVNLVFEGVMTDAEVKINGQLVGDIHQGAFYRFKYDVTEQLRYGERNELEVTVSKMSANKSVNRAERYADYWVFGGIFRPVYLEILPQEHIERVAINATAAGNFDVDVFTGNIGKGKTLELTIYDTNDRVVARQQQPLVPNATQTRLATRVEAPLRWTSEAPNLYRAELTLRKAKKTVHQVNEVFGFRTVEIRENDGVYINGKQVKFKGVNRHAFWPETGRTLNRNIDRLDVELMKEMNMNAVRCSHYPPDKSFLSLCDSLGLYVLDELAGWQNAYDTEVGEKLVREMVLRDVNHPSIVFWSNGNEGGTNKELDDDFHKYDPSARPVIHAHHKPGNDYNGIDANHYEKYYSSKSILEDSLIYMPTEFLHAQDDGGGAAGLDDFWELFWASPRSAGGFLWALLDEGVVRTDLNNRIDVNRVNAPDGLLGPHREKEGSFYALKEIFSPVKMLTDTLSPDFTGELEIENRFHFTNLNQCVFRAELVDFPAPAQREKGHTVGKELNFTGPDLAPEMKGQLKLPLPQNWQGHDALYLHAFGPDGKKIMTWTWPIQPSGKWRETLGHNLDDETLPAAHSAQTDSTVSLSANKITAIFDIQSGRLIRVVDSLGQNPKFGNGPVLVSGENKPLRHSLTTKGKAQVLEVAYEGHFKYLRWTMFPSGMLQLDYEYEMEGEYPFLGVSFDCPESDIIGVKWLGNGPYRVWKNRMKGGQLDVWKAVYNNTSTGSSPWVYPEFKGYYSDVSWMVFETAEGRYSVGTDQNELFVRLFDFYGLTSANPHPALPTGDVSFLDAIPPIGTKLAIGLDIKPGELGPQSEWNQTKGPIKRTLYLKFGL